jgi:hypothetical protein
MSVLRNAILKWTGCKPGGAGMIQHGQDHQFQFGDVDVGEVGQLGGSRHSWESIQGRKHPIG